MLGFGASGLAKLAKDWATVDIECFLFGEARVAFLIRVSLRGEGDFSVNGRKLLELLRRIGARCGDRFDGNSMYCICMPCKAGHFLRQMHQVRKICSKNELILRNRFYLIPGTVASLAKLFAGSILSYNFARNHAITDVPTAIYIQIPFSRARSEIG